MMDTLAVFEAFVNHVRAGLPLPTALVKFIAKAFHGYLLAKGRKSLEDTFHLGRSRFAAKRWAYRKQLESALIKVAFDQKDNLPLKRAAADIAKKERISESVLLGEFKRHGRTLKGALFGAKKVKKKRR